MNLKASRTSSLMLSAVVTSSLALSSASGAGVVRRDFESDETWSGTGAISTAFAHAGFQSAALDAGESLSETQSPALDLTGLNAFIWIFPDTATPTGELSILWTDSSNSSLNSIDLTALTGRAWNRVAFEPFFGVVGFFGPIDPSDVIGITMLASATTTGTTYVDGLHMTPGLGLSARRTSSLGLSASRASSVGLSARRFNGIIEGMESGWTGGELVTSPVYSGSKSLHIGYDAENTSTKTGAGPIDLSGFAGVTIAIQPVARGSASQSLFLTIKESVSFNTLIVDTSGIALGEWGLVYAPFVLGGANRDAIVEFRALVPGSGIGPELYLDHISVSGN